MLKNMASQWMDIRLLDREMFNRATATNRQPWRIVKDGNIFHFYEQHAKALADRGWDVQRIDMGIALNHFMSVAGGSLSVKNPGIEIPNDTDYIATVEVKI